MKPLRDLLRLVGFTRSPRPFKPVPCPACGAILVLRPDPEKDGALRPYCGHCGTFH